MGWNIGLIGNTVKVSKQCAHDLFKVGEARGIWHEEAEVVEGGKLSFNPDHLEHMDFLWDDAILAVLAKHKVNGDITFGSLEGDNAGRFWGYRFADGAMTRLQGRVLYEPVSS